MPRTLKLATRPIHQIPLAEGETVVDTCARNTVAALILKSPPDFRRTAKNGVSGFKRHADNANIFEIRILQPDDTWRSIPLPLNRENWTHLRPLPDGRWLLIRGRAVGPADRNAFILGPDGRELSRFHAGDAIQNVDVVGNGPVWFSYFDEAYGNKHEPTNCGFAAVDPAHPGGRLDFCFNRQSTRGKLDDIIDAYAMNVVSANEAWVYYYDEFSLIQIKNGKPAEAHLDLKSRGAKVVAITDDEILFLGADFDVYEAWLMARKSGRRTRVKLVDHKGRRACMSHGHAAGPLVHAEENGIIWRMDLRELK